MVRLILPDSLRRAAADGAAPRGRPTARSCATTPPRFSVYRMTFTGDDGAPRHDHRRDRRARARRTDGVLPHERTLPKAKSDRLALLRATRANLDPIWGLSLAAGLTDLLAGRRRAARTRRSTTTACCHELFRGRSTPRASTRSAPRSSTHAARARRRPPPLRDRRHVPRRARRDDPGAGVDHDARRRAGRRRALRARHPPPPHDVGDVDLRAALDRLVHGRATLGPNTPDGVAALERAMRATGGLGLVDADGLALLVPTAALDDGARRDARRRCATSTPPASTPACARARAGRDARLPQRRADRRRRRARRATADAAVLLRPVSVASIRAAAAARRADAGEDDVLRAEAAHRHGVPPLDD